MGIIDVLKEAMKLAQASDNAPLVRQLTDAMAGTVTLSVENHELRERVRELEGLLRFRDNLMLDQQVLWTMEDATPYCRFCWEKDSLALHLNAYDRDDGTQLWHCPNCKGS